MKVVVLSTSLRPGSNSHAMAEQFAEGAKSAGHEVELECVTRPVSNRLARQTHVHAEEHWRYRNSHK